MAKKGILLQTYPIVECLLPGSADEHSLLFAELTKLVSAKLCDPSLHCTVRGSHGLLVEQPIIKELPDLQVTRLYMRATEDPSNFMERLGSDPKAKFPLGFVIAGQVLTGLDSSNTFSGLQAVNPLNLMEGHLLEPFQHRDRFERALMKLCGSSTRLGLGIYLPDSKEAEVFARSLTVGSPLKSPAIVPDFEEVSNFNPVDMAGIIAQSLINNQDALFGAGRGIF